MKNEIKWIYLIDGNYNLDDILRIVLKKIISLINIYEYIRMMDGFHNLKNIVWVTF